MLALHVEQVGLALKRPFNLLVPGIHLGLGPRLSLLQLVLPLRLHSLLLLRLHNRVFLLSLHRRLLIRELYLAKLIITFFF